MSGSITKFGEIGSRKKNMANNIKIKDNRSTYPGGKGASGVHQNIINLIPPHDVYIETHLGGGSIMLRKRPAPINIGIDLDPEVIEAWTKTDITISEDSSRRNILSTTIKKMVTARAPLDKNTDVPRKTIHRDHTTKNPEWRRTTSPFLVSGDGKQYFTFINDDAARWLKNYNFTGNEFIYVDPPYLMETRKGGKLYDCEYTTLDHVKLLSCLQALPVNIMISGYWSSLYDNMLPGWNTFYFEAQTRQGMATEWLWFNYPFPEKLHDYSYLGANFRQRERIKLKRDRWVSRLQKLPALERNAIIEALLNCLPDPTSIEKTRYPGK